MEGPMSHFGVAVLLRVQHHRFAYISHTMANFWFAERW